MIDKSIRYFYEGGSVPPRRVDIKGQDHMLAYITPQEGELLRAYGGSGRPGPMGIPSFEIDIDLYDAYIEKRKKDSKQSGIDLEKEYGPQGVGGTYINPEADPNYNAPADPPASDTPSEPSSDVGFIGDMIQDDAEALQEAAMEAAMESPPEALNPVRSSGPVSVPTNYDQTFPINVAPVFPATPPYPTGGSPFVRPQQLPNVFVRPQQLPNVFARTTPGEVLMRARRIT